MNPMGGLVDLTVAVLVFVVIEVLLLAGLALSLAMRGRRRLNTVRVAGTLLVPVTTVLCVAGPVWLRVTFSDALAILGIILALALPLAGTFLSRSALRVRVAVVIPSMVPFHVELRAGLQEGLLGIRVELVDDYKELQTTALEALGEFEPGIRRMLRRRPDYLVACAPAVEHYLGDLEPLLLRFTQAGGGLILIDNFPNPEQLARFGKRVGTVTSDVRGGVQALLGKVKRMQVKADRILVIAGPQYSQPAQIRQEALRQAFTDTEVNVVDTDGWTRDSAREEMSKALVGDQPPDLVFCGNDWMALGAVEAIREARKSGPRRKKRTSVVARGLRDTRVIGYDGITRALYAIAEPENPLLMTYLTPPAVYGHSIADMIRHDLASRRSDGGLASCVIRASLDQVVTDTNVEHFLE